MTTYRAVSSPPVASVNRERISVPADVLERHHPDADLVLTLAAASNALGAVLRLAGGMNRPPGHTSGPGPVCPPSHAVGDRLQLYLLAALHLKQAVDVLGADRVWRLAELGHAGDPAGSAAHEQWRTELPALTRTLALEVRVYLGLHWIPDALWQWRRRVPTDDVVLWQAGAAPTSTPVSPLAEELLCAALFDGRDPGTVLDDRMTSIVEAHDRVVAVLRVVIVGLLKDRERDRSSESRALDDPVAAES